jgi:hypothetical protein
MPNSLVIEPGQKGYPQGYPISYPQKSEISFPRWASVHCAPSGCVSIGVQTAHSNLESKKDSFRFGLRQVTEVSLFGWQGGCPRMAVSAYNPNLPAGLSLLSFARRT